MTLRERPRILLTGGTGQIGFELRRELAALGDVIAPTRAELDLAQPENVRTYVREHHPDLVINAGAYTAVDTAEAERGLCDAVNAEAPGVLAEEAKRVGAALIHYSTDYVFDGTKKTPYVETDAAAPLNAYGASKLAGERAIQAVGGASVVFRTSWVFGARGRNFLTTMLRLAREHHPIRVVNDQRGVPNWSRAVASATRRFLEMTWVDGLDGRPANLGGVAGIYHLTGSSSATWFELARTIIEADPAREEHRYTKLTQITSRELDAAAVRPAYSVLSGDKLRTMFGLTLPNWETQLEAAIGGGLPHDRFESVSVEPQGD